MAKNKLRYAFYLSLLVLTIVSFSACDSISPLGEEPKASNSQLIDSIQAWYNDQVSIEDVVSKSLDSTIIDNDKLMRRFPPDWNNAQFIETNRGDRAMVAKLGEDYDLSFDGKTARARVIIVTLDNNDQPKSGEILGFASFNASHLEDISGLAQAYLEDDFGSLDIAASRYSMRFKLRDIIVAQPGKRSFSIPAEAKRCYGVKDSGSKQLVEWVCVEVTDGWQTCAGSYCGEEWYDTWWECHISGGGGGGEDGGDPSSGGSGGGGTGGGGTTPPVNTIDHTTLPQQPPDCSQTQTDPRLIAWCEGRVPAGAERAVIENAIARIAANGGACYNIANTLSNMLNSQEIRIFNQTNQSFGGAAKPYGDWMVISDRFITTYEINRTPDGNINLASALTHEADHILNNTSSSTDELGHLIGYDGFHTVNSIGCSQ